MKKLSNLITLLGQVQISSTVLALASILLAGFALYVVLKLGAPLEIRPPSADVMRGGTLGKEPKGLPPRQYAVE